MKTSHRIAAALVTAIALTSCTGGADTNDDIDQPDITTDTNEEDDDGPDTSVEDSETDPDGEDDEIED